MRTNRQAVRTLTGHTGTVRCLQFDQHKVVSGSNDCTIRVWDIHNGDCVATLSGYGTDLLSSYAYMHLADESRFWSKQRVPSVQALWRGALPPHGRCDAGVRVV